MKWNRSAGRIPFHQDLLKSLGATVIGPVAVVRETAYLRTRSPHQNGHVQHTGEMMEYLKLLALDEDDLRIVSAHVQDAVFKSGDLNYDSKTGQFSLVANRFVWETATEKSKSFERHRALIVFKRIRAVRTLGIDRKTPDSVQNLLAIDFTKRGEGPEGTILLVLAGKAAIELDVECIEVQLADTGGAWETGLKPRHPAG